MGTVVCAMAQVGKCYCYCSKQTQLGILGLVIAAISIGVVLIIVFTLDSTPKGIDDCAKDEDCLTFFTDFNNKTETVECQTIAATKSTPLMFKCKKKNKGECKNDKECEKTELCKNLVDKKCECSRNLKCVIVSKNH